MERECARLESKKTSAELEEKQNQIINNEKPQ